MCIHPELDLTPDERDKAEENADSSLFLTPDERDREDQDPDSSLFSDLTTATRPGQRRCLEGLSRGLLSVHVNAGRGPWCSLKRMFAKGAGAPSRRR